MTLYLAINNVYLVISLMHLLWVKPVLEQHSHSPFPLDPYPVQVGDDDTVQQEEAGEG